MVSESQEYYLSTSQTELIGGEWQSTIPTILDGTFLWLRRKITNSDNNTTYTTPVCLTSSIVNNNTYTENDCLQYNHRVAAGDYISAGTIAAFDVTLGLVGLSAGLNLDTTKPILYSASEVEQSAVTTDMFLMHSDVDLREITGDQSISVSDGLGVYLKGTLEDTVFTLESDWLVFGDPITEGSENYIYVLLGHTGASTLEAVSYSMTLESEHPMYACVAEEVTETVEVEGVDTEVTSIVYKLIPYDESIRIISQDAVQQLANVDEVVMMPNGQTSTLSKWMTFSPNNSLVIGASKDGEEEPQKLQLTYKKISFMYGTQEKAWISQDGFFFNQGEVVKSLRIGGYIIRDDGHGGFAIV